MLVVTQESLADRFRALREINEQIDRQVASLQAELEAAADANQHQSVATAAATRGAAGNNSSNNSSSNNDDDDDKSGDDDDNNSSNNEDKLPASPERRVEVQRIEVFGPQDNAEDGVGDRDRDRDRDRDSAEQTQQKDEVNEDQQHREGVDDAKGNARDGEHDANGITDAKSGEHDDAGQASAA